MSDRSRVLFVGNVQASEVALRAILGISSTEVVAIVTKKASAYNSDHRDLSDIAEQFRIPWRHVRDINASHIHEWIRHFAPEVLFVSGWSQLVRLVSVVESGHLETCPKRCDWIPSSTLAE